MKDQVTSFSVDHTKLKKGMYTNRVDGDVITYDIRMKTPNAGDYLGNGEIHTIEHLFATYARSSRYAGGLLYIGPMGCRTGFYMLTRGLTDQEAIDLVRESFDFIAHFSGEIPGSHEAECGNYREHDLPAAQATSREMGKILAFWTPDDLVYPV